MEIESINSDTCLNSEPVYEQTDILKSCKNPM